MTHTHTGCTFHPFIAPGDYGSLTNLRLGPFNIVVNQISFNVSVVNDNIPEDAEMFIASLTLDPADQARIGNHLTVSPDVATVTIQDNDGMPLFTEVILPHDMVSELHLFNLFAAVITVGYVQTAMTVLESDGVATLTVAISLPPGEVSIETSFALLVSTMERTATGLPWRSRLELDFFASTQINTYRTIILALSLGLSFLGRRGRGLGMKLTLRLDYP